MLRWFDGMQQFVTAGRDFVLATLVQLIWTMTIVGLALFAGSVVYLSFRWLTSWRERRYMATVRALAAALRRRNFRDPDDPG